MVWNKRKSRLFSWLFPTLWYVLDSRKVSTLLRHAKSSSSFSATLEIILLFRLKSASVAATISGWCISRQNSTLLGTQRCHSYHFVSKAFALSLSPWKRYRDTLEWKEKSSLISSKIINLVNSTRLQKRHNTMKNEESHWLVIDCDSRFVTGRNHISNNEIQCSLGAARRRETQLSRLFGTRNQYKCTSFWNVFAFFIQREKQDGNEAVSAEIRKVCQSRLLLLD